MNLQQFKAWFEGFTESLDGAPNEKQWKRIKQQVSQITYDPSIPVIVREVVPRPYYSGWPYQTVTCSAQSVSNGIPEGTTIAANTLSAWSDQGRKDLIAMHESGG